MDRKHPKSRSHLFLDTTIQNLAHVTSSHIYLHDRSSEFQTIQVIPPEVPPAPVAPVPPAVPPAPVEPVPPEVPPAPVGPVAPAARLHGVFADRVSYFLSYIYSYIF